MIEYAILIVMAIFTIGFAWLWIMEQRKARKKQDQHSKKAERTMMKQ